jgi:hypothetical protein
LLDIFKAEAENQYVQRLKLCDREEYYIKLTAYGQMLGPFPKYLQENGIVAQYSTPDKPQQNGVAERRNHTLMDVVRSILSYSIFLVKLWMEALKIIMHILNWVPIKSILKTPYELWTGRKPSLKNLRVSGSRAEAKVFHPNIEKLGPKSISYHFIGCPDKSKGYLFYCPNNYAKFVET